MKQTFYMISNNADKNKKYLGHKDGKEDEYTHKNNGYTFTDLNSALKYLKNARTSYGIIVKVKI